MIIHFERSGGFTGISRQVVIDSQELDPQEQAELEALVEEAGFFDAEIATAAAQGADQFNYTLTIEHGRRLRSVTLAEGAMPPEWEALVERITTIARRPRSQGNQAG